MLRNGVKLTLFEGEEKRQAKRLIYTSIPNRGLVYLPEIYLKLKQKHADLELHVFSSPVIYNMNWPPKKALPDENDQLLHLIKQMPNCYIHGSVLQKQLAREFMKSAIWTYPTNFEETSCISAMEAQAGGCAIVTTDLAALKETVGEAGILMDERPVSKNYSTKFIEACDSLLSDPALLNRYSSIAKERARSFDWKVRAGELLDYIRNRYGFS